MTVVAEEGLLKEEKLKELESEYNTISSPINLNGFYGYDGWYEGKTVLPSEDRVNPSTLAVIAQRKRLEKNNTLFEGVKNVRAFTKNALERAGEKVKEENTPAAKQHLTSENITKLNTLAPFKLENSFKLENNPSVIDEEKAQPDLFDQLRSWGLSASTWAEPKLASMGSKLQQFSPNLAQASIALAESQPEAYFSAKGGCCCCAPSHAAEAGTVINQNTSINLTSHCQDPQQLGQAVANEQDKVNRNLVRKITPRAS